jgi:hypothetical protein
MGLVLLAGCGGGAGGWTKPGADDAQTASAYQDCLGLTGTATRTDFDIDQDISASRASDLQRSSLLRGQTQQTHEDNRDRAAAILESCMQAKGFTRPPQ